MKTTDLTQGAIAGHFVRLSAPLIVGNILQQLYNTIDALVIGRCAGQQEFAAIGVAGAVMNLFQFAIIGGCTGLSVLFAQQYGSGDGAAFRRQHFLSLAAGLPVVAALSAAGWLLLSGLLSVVQTPQALFGFVKLYLQIVLAGLPASYLYNLYSALLRAAGDTRAALLALAFSVFVNLLLDWLFIARLGWGVAGAAVATVAAQLLAAALCFVYLRRARPALLFGRADCRLQPGSLQKTARFALVNALHQSGLYIGKLLVQGAVNTGGVELIAAYTATTRIEGFANSFGDSGAAATSILAAQNLGAQKPARVRRTFWKSLWLLGALGVACSLVMYLFAGEAAAFLLGAHTGAAYESTVDYLRIIAIFYTLCFTGNTFAGYFNGVGRVNIPLAGAVGHITLRVVLCYLWVGRWGLEAVAVATGIGWVLVNLFWAGCCKYTGKTQRS